jgi:two-component system chemotaxis response regulator CheY
MPVSILLVDDSFIARKMLLSLLPDIPMVVREAEGGAQCLKLYEEERPDLVLLDLTMPDIPGLDILARLKTMDPRANVVLVTADTQESNQIRAKDLGALSVVEKPPETQQLLDVINLVMP